MKKPTDPCERERLSNEIADALNLLAQYAADNLPPGYVVQIDLTNDEACLTLYDPMGESCSDATSGDEAALMEACDYAQERTRGEDGPES